MIDELTKDWEWLSFLAQYCAGKNISAGICRDVKWWVLGIAALVAVVVAWWILGRLARVYESWKLRRLRAKIADSETMKEHVWAGHNTQLTSSDQRARRDQRPR